MIVADAHELTYAAYQDRQYREVTPEGLAERAQRLAPGGRFRFINDAWRAEPYRGHAVVSMVAADPGNAALLQRLLRTQVELQAALPEPGLLYALPAASFHQTVANTLSAERFERHVLDAGISGMYPRRVGEVLGGMPEPIAAESVRMRMIGLALFGSALGVLGAFATPAEFDRVRLFRERFYQHPVIRELGIRRTRPFIGHVTLAYLGRAVTEAERERFVTTAARINDTLFREPAVFTLPRAELRAYEHLAEFQPMPELPSVRV